MDPLSLTVATLLSMKAAEAFGGEAGRGAWSGLRRLGDLVRNKLGGNPEVEEVLNDSQDQSVETKTEIIATAIERQVQFEPSFRQELSDILRQAEEDPAIAQFVTKISDNASVGKITNIGDIHGNVSF